MINSLLSTYNYFLTGSVSWKIQIRNSIRALFPERECFTLVRPLEAEHELQHLDEIPVCNLSCYEFQHEVELYSLRKLHDMIVPQSQV